MADFNATAAVLPHGILLTGGTVITMVPGRPEHEQVDVLVKDDRIVEVGHQLHHPEAEVVDVSGRIITPGFVNAHLHTWQTALRAAGADWTLMEYVAKMHGGIAGRFRIEDILTGSWGGALAQLDQGTTTIGDWAHNCRSADHGSAALQGLLDAGIRARFLHGTPYRDPEMAHPLDEVDGLIAAAEGTLIRVGMAVQGPQYSASKVAVADLAAARERGIMASFHQSGGDLNPGWHAARAERVFGRHVNVAHGMDLDDDWLSYLAGEGVTVTSTPENELGQGHGWPIVSRFLKAGGIVSIGTDTDAVVSGDIRTAARVAFALHRASLHDLDRSRDLEDRLAGDVCNWHALEWITSGGARALGMDDQIGTIAAGMQADLVVVADSGPHLAPSHHPVATVLSADRHDIEDVMVAGRWRKRDGALLGTHPDELHERLAAAAAHLLVEYSGMPAITT